MKKIIKFVKKHACNICAISGVFLGVSDLVLEFERFSIIAAGVTIIFGFLLGFIVVR